MKTVSRAGRAARRYMSSEARLAVAESGMCRILHFQRPGGAPNRLTAGQSLGALDRIRRLEHNILVSSILIRGDDANFVNGLDLHELLEWRDKRAELLKSHARFFAKMQALRHARTVGYLNGEVGGVSLAVTGKLYRAIRKGTVFRMNEPEQGLVPFGGSCALWMGGESHPHWGARC
eukprot:scaffold472_cov264-Pinguiococcus_pyrenoidosus.AAC.8